MQLLQLFWQTLIMWQFYFIQNKTHCTNQEIQAAWKQIKMKEAFVGLEFGLTEMCFPSLGPSINYKWFWGNITALYWQLLFFHTHNKWRWDRQQIFRNNELSLTNLWQIITHVIYRLKICAGLSSTCRCHKNAGKFPRNIVWSEISSESQEKQEFHQNWLALLFHNTVLLT